MDEELIAILVFGRHRHGFPTNDALNLASYKKNMGTLHLKQMGLFKNDLDYFGCVTPYTKLTVRADVLLVKPVFFRYLLKQAKKYHMHMAIYPTQDDPTLFKLYPQGLIYFTIFESEIKIDMYTYAEDSIVYHNRINGPNQKHYEYSNDKEVWD